MKRLSLPVLIVALSSFLVVPLLRAQDEVEELIELGSQWKYWDKGTSLGANWTAATFNDTAWDVGNGAFGYGVANDPQDPNPYSVVTQLSFGNNPGGKHLAYYFRKVITVGNPASFENVLLRYLRDDGIIIYINGVPVHTENMPEGAADFRTPALSTIGTGNEQGIRTVKLDSNVLKAGTNTIAAEVHQANSISADMFFDLELSLTESAPELGVVRPGNPRSTAAFRGVACTEFTQGFNGELKFIRREDQDYELEWDSREGSAAGISGVATFGFWEDEDLDGAPQFGCWEQSNTFTSEKVDISNYDDVRVRLGLRTELHGNQKFNKSDKITAELKVSTNGVKFNTVKWLNLLGTGSAGGEDESIDFTALWGDGYEFKVLIPTEVQGNWLAKDYDDAGWMTATKGIGYSNGTTFDSFIGTLVTPEGEAVDLKVAMKEPDKRSSALLRFPFTAEGSLAWKKLQLHVRHDDAFVAYLNGTEIARSAQAPTSIAWDAIAKKSANGSNDEPIDVTEHLGKIVDGENMLALQVFNKDAGGSDILAWARLSSGVPGAPKPPKEGDPANLEDLLTGLNGTFKVVETPEGMIPDNAVSVQVKITMKNNDFEEVFYMDDLCFTGEPRIVDSYSTYMQKRTEFTGDDLLPGADPDADGVSNLVEYALVSDASVDDPEGMVNGEMQLYAPDVEFGETITLEHRMIAGATQGNSDDGFQVQDILYVPEYSFGEVVPGQGWLWFSSSGGGAPLWDQVGAFEENDDGSVNVKFNGKLPIEGQPEVYFRLRIDLLGF